MATAKGKPFFGKESKTEERKEKKVGPAAYARGEKREGKKDTSSKMSYKSGGMVGKKGC